MEERKENENEIEIEKKKERSRSSSKDSNNSKKKEKQKQYIKNFYEILEECKKPRDEYLFKIVGDGDNENNIKKYIMSTITRKAEENDIFDIEMIEYHKIKTTKPKNEEFLYFKLNNKVTLNQVYIKSRKKENLPQINLIQLRPHHFFEDNY